MSPLEGVDAPDDAPDVDPVGVVVLTEPVPLTNVAVVALLVGDDAVVFVVLGVVAVKFERP